MKKTFDTSFQEYSSEDPERIFAYMKKARSAAALFQGKDDLPFPFQLSMLTLLNVANPLRQRYYFIEDDVNYAFFTVYENRMNLFTYGKAEWFMNIQTVAFPCSLSCSGFLTNNVKWMLSYIKTIKGCKLVLNLDEKTDIKGMSFGETLPTCELVIPEGINDIETYISALRSPYRRRIRIAIKNCSDIEVKRIKGDDTDVHPLYLQTYEKSEYKLECLNKEFFDQADGEKIVFFREGQPAGFVLLKENGKELVFMLCGMDYEPGGDNADLYFYMLLKIVEYAFEKNLRIIDFGQTSEKTKLKFGAQLKKKYFYAHHSNPFLNLFAMAGKHMLEYKYDFPQFHVFKE
ncbi:MAG: GNAT family N-acetyltransferase [Lachnospiraceae bacterium]|nr:GNAT family N-acetyltransferase [Lachnospiraceae bacterium]